MEIVSVINYKGGVGKTTITANIGAELAWRGNKVLLMDMDAQASLSFSFIKPQIWESKYADSQTIKQWFESLQNNNPLPLQSLIIKPQRIAAEIPGSGRLDIILSHLALINVDLDLAMQLGGATVSIVKQNYLKVHSQLRHAVQGLEDDGYDIVLIDCPPNFNIVTKNAIAASDAILVPARPDYLSTMGIDYLMRSVNELVSTYNDFVQLGDADSTDTIDPDILGVVFTMIQVYGGKPVAAQQAYIAQTRRTQGITVFDSWIRRHPRVFGNAPLYGVPVVIGGGHRDAVGELEEITTEFINKTGL